MDFICAPSGFSGCKNKYFQNKKPNLLYILCRKVKDFDFMFCYTTTLIKSEKKQKLYSLQYISLHHTAQIICYEIKRFGGQSN